MSRTIDLDLLPHQAEFIEDVTTRDLSLVGGRGCGKTFSLATKLITLAHLQAGCVGAALSPTGSMFKKVLEPEMFDALARMGFIEGKNFHYHRTDRRFDLKVGKKVTNIFCLSAENVRDGLGLNLAFFGLDEADTMSPEIAFESWRKLSGALREGNPLYRQKVAVSTPEGFGFMYQHWVAEVAEARQKLESGKELDEETINRLTTVINSRKIIHGDSEQNFHLTTDFFDDLRATYPPHYLSAYIKGQFVNMTSGSVYPDYDPAENHTPLTLETLPDNVRTLHMGWDFNVKEPNRHPYGIFTTVAVIIGGQPYVIDECFGESRTSDAIEVIKEKYAGYNIMVYPDATGKSDRTSATESDRAQLRAAGFTDMSPAGNPRIRDRVNAVNAQILNGQGVRRLRINKERCPTLARCLMQQPYDKNGDPQKDTGFDDPCDSLGYFINVHWPVRRTEAFQLRLAA